MLRDHHARRVGGARRAIIVAVITLTLVIIIGAANEAVATTTNETTTTAWAARRARGRLAEAVRAAATRAVDGDLHRRPDLIIRQLLKQLEAEQCEKSDEFNFDLIEKPKLYLCNH